MIRHKELSLNLWSVDYRKQPGYDPNLGAMDFHSFEADPLLPGTEATLSLSELDWATLSKGSAFWAIPVVFIMYEKSRKSCGVNFWAIYCHLTD